MNDCIMWSGAKLPSGYGRTCHGGKDVYAHRLSYCVANSIELSTIDGLVVRHKCDNPSCVNPTHLELGTQAENMHDMFARGRQPPQTGKGVNNGNVKLTDEQVLLMRAEYIPHSRQYGTRALARKYGVAQQLVSFIVNRKLWKHI